MDRFIRNNTELILKIAIKTGLIVYAISLFYNHAFSSWIPRRKFPAIIGRVENNTALYLGLSIAGVIVLGLLFSLVVDGVFICIKTVKWDGLWKDVIANSVGLVRRLAVSMVNIIIAAVVGLLLMLAAFSLPLDNIISNVADSSYVFQDEGTYPQIVPFCFSKIDNYTDAAILQEAAGDKADNVINKVLMIYPGDIDSVEDPCERMLAHFINGQPYDGYISYPRYWHGYLILVKPLLELMRYGQIRIINGLCQAILCFIICKLLAKRDCKQYIIPYLLSYLMLMPIALMSCMQFSSCYYAFSLGSLALLLLSDEKRDRFSYLIFLNIGIFVAYFDYLTYPLATFGIPFVLYLALNRDWNTERKLFEVVRNGIFWCIGYAGMWISKWIITALLTDYDIMSDALGEVGMRIGDSSGDGSLYYSSLVGVMLNYLTFILTPITIVLFIYTIVLLRQVIRLKDKTRVIRIMIPYIVLAVTPVAWYMFATNHSMIHYWFTSKSCAVTVLALLCGLVECKAVCDNK